jgi:hypothetical protein
VPEALKNIDDVTPKMTPALRRETAAAFTQSG